MKHAETVTFGGSALDRAGEVRADKEAVAALRADDAARAILFWRGKVLIDPARPASVVRLPLDHPVLADAGSAPILLGREEGAARFAYDLSPCMPDDFDPRQLGSFVDQSEQRHPMLPPDYAFVEMRRVMTWLSPRDAELAATGKAILAWHENHSYCARCGFETVVNDAGWQRNCPACRASHFPRTDPVAIMTVEHVTKDGERLVLLGRGLGWPEGMYSALAGFIEPGETLEQGAARELRQRRVWRAAWMLGSARGRGTRVAQRGAPG